MSDSTEISPGHQPIARTYVAVASLLALSTAAAIATGHERVSGFVLSALDRVNGRDAWVRSVARWIADPELSGGLTVLALAGFAVAAGAAAAASSKGAVQRSRAPITMWVAAAMLWEVLTRAQALGVYAGALGALCAAATVGEVLDRRGALRRDARRFRLLELGQLITVLVIVLGYLGMVVGHAMFGSARREPLPQVELPTGAVPLPVQLHRGAEMPPGRHTDGVRSA